jgi:hypothetical protein
MSYVPRIETVELAWFVATFGARGQPINNAVAEDRDYGRYSSCGDLIHAVLYAIGCRDSDIVNRNECGGWEVGKNLSKLFFGPLLKEVVIRPKRGELKPGDILLYDGDRSSAHACFYLATRGMRIVTADYGQPGGDVIACSVRESPAFLRLRGRRVTHSISLASVPLEAEPISAIEWLRQHNLDPNAWFAAGKWFDEIVTDSAERAAVEDYPDE